MKSAPKRLAVDPPVPPAKKEAFDEYGEEMDIEEENFKLNSDHEEEGDRGFIDDMEQEEDGGRLHAQKDSNEIERSEKGSRLHRIREDKDEPNDEKSEEKKEATGKMEEFKVEYDEDDNSFDDL